MTRRPLRLAASTAALAAALLATGCASEKDHYYTLALPLSAQAEVAQADPQVFIELAPIALPERLAKPQMLVSQDRPGAEVQVMEQHRWASSFESELRDTLSAEIAAGIGGIDVTKGGRPATQPVWRIAVQVRRFDAVEGSRVDADFSWTLRRVDADRSLSCNWAGTERVGPGMDALAGGAQRVTQRAALAVGRQVLALQGDPSATCLGGASPS